MRKRMCGLFLGMLCATVFTGCGLSEKAELEDTSKKEVEMVVWGAEEDTELMNQIIQSFIIREKQIFRFHLRCRENPNVKMY